MNFIVNYYKENFPHHHHRGSGHYHQNHHHINKMTMFIGIILFATTTLISASSIDHHEENFKNLTSFNTYHNPSYPSLVGATTTTTTTSWFGRFLYNLFNYFVLIVPLLGFVLLIKRGIIPNNSRVVQNRFVQLLVYGRADDGGGGGGGDHPYGKLPLVISDTVKNTTGGGGNGATRGLSSLSPSSSFITEAGLLLFCFFGLQISYLTWGLLQEKIMTQQYEMPIEFFQQHYHHSHHQQQPQHLQLQSQSQLQLHPPPGPLVASNSLISITSLSSSASSYRFKFRNSQFLVFVNRLLAFVIAASILTYRNRRTLSQYFFHTKQPPAYQYLYSSLTNILSSWCQYEALKYVSFPVQVLSKGCKMIAVMIMSQMMLRQRKYKRTEWCFAFVISFGIWLFLLNEQVVDEHHHHNTNHHNDDHVDDDQDHHHHLISGIIILCFYLTFDSFTSNWQESLFTRYRINHFHMMCYNNLYSIALTVTSLCTQSDLLPAFRLLLLANGTLLRDTILLSACSAIGQLFLFYTISRFGAVVFTLIMTLRQVFAILLSVIVYDHTMTIFGITGVCIVFSALFANIYYKFQQKRLKSPRSSGGGGGKGDIV